MLATLSAQERTKIARTFTPDPELDALLAEVRKDPAAFNRLAPARRFALGVYETNRRVHEEETAETGAT